MWFEVEYSKNSPFSYDDEGKKGPDRVSGDEFSEHRGEQGKGVGGERAGKEEGGDDGEGCGRFAVEVAEGGEGIVIVDEIQIKIHFLS